MPQLVERCLSGEELSIARAGKLVACLRRLRLLDGEMQIPDDFNTSLPKALLSAFAGAINQTLKLSPQPQAFLALGLLKRKPSFNPDLA